MVLKLMLRFLICGSLLFTLFSKRGSTQPAQCEEVYHIEEDRSSFVIVPGVNNCFRCALLTVGTVSWLVSVTGDFVPASTVPLVETEANYLVLPMPTDYVEPGNAGRRDIICTNGSLQLEARLISPELVTPIFFNTTIIDEGDELTLTCINRNPTETSTLQIHGPSGKILPTYTGVFTVSNATRRYAGRYTCVVTSTVQNNYTVTATSTVIIQYGPEIVSSNSSYLEVALGSELFLQCDYSGVPSPTSYWLHNGTLQTNGVSGINITGGGLGDSFIAIRVESATRDSGGTYSCNITNIIDTVQMNQVVFILSPPSKPLNIYVEGVASNGLYVTWEQPANNGGKPITLYKVTVLEVSLIQIISSRISNVIVRNEQLTQNTTYIVTVEAANEVGFGAIAIALGTTQSILEPQRIFDQPTFDNITSSSALVMWKFPGGTVEAYIVQFVLAIYGFDSNSVKNVTVDGSEISAVIGNLLPVATYKVRVAVINSHGTSIFSPSESFITQCSCSPPIVTDITVLEGTTIILNCTSTIESVNFTWSKDLDSLPENSNVIPTDTYLRIKMVTIQNAGRYVCTAYNTNDEIMAYNDFVVNVQPIEEDNKDQCQKIIIVAGGILAAVVITTVVMLVINLKLIAMIKSKRKNHPVEAKVQIEAEYDIVGQYPASLVLKTERNVAYSNNFKRQDQNN